MKSKKDTKSLREEILEAQDLPTVEVEIPEWTKKKVYIRSLTAVERDDFETEQLQENEDGTLTRNNKNFRAKLLVRALCEDPEGKIRIFTDADAEALGEKSSAALDKCFIQAKKLAGLSNKDQEELVKNSKQTQD